jgi:hypothetical protein
VIVEAAEAGASAETVGCGTRIFPSALIYLKVEHSHSHGTSECKYQKKYMKAKAKNGKLEMVRKAILV